MGRQTVVYTPGVWDLLHAGHLNLLQRAKLAGDYLIVGVCSDRLVDMTKGKAVVSETQRAQLINAMSCVDEVHIYDSLDQRVVLELFKVDVFCVGEEFGQYGEHQLTLEYCDRENIYIHVVKRYPGVSSTELRARAIERVKHDDSPPKHPSIAVDYHDCLSFDPEFFRTLFQTWPGKAYILSGMPERQRAEVCKQLSEMGFKEGVNFERLLLGFDYDLEKLSVSHFKRMREYKLARLKQYDISVYFDDNPFYVDWMREHGITTFQTVLPSQYIEEFGKNDAHFTCHLQEKQFHYLHSLTDIEVKPRKHASNPCTVHTR